MESTIEANLISMKQLTGQFWMKVQGIWVESEKDIWFGVIVKTRIHLHIKAESM